MKIFFLGDRVTAESKEANSRIIKILEELGHSVDKQHANASHDEDVHNFEKAYKRNLNSIKNCDVLVVETTGMYSGTGFQIATALNMKKPVLALFNSDFQRKASSTLKGATSSNKLYTFAEYNKNTLPDVLKKFTNKVKSLLDTKFILIISPEIDRYLEWAGENKRMHKAQIVRNAVENMIDKDKEYKDFLKGM